MTLPLVTVETIANHPEGLCQAYPVEVLQMLFADPEFNAIYILTADPDLPGGGKASMQDRLYSIMREDVVTTEGLATIDQYVSDRFAATEATTVGGQNCKSQWPQPTPFRRAVLLSELLRHETGSDAQFRSELLSILEGI